MGDIKVHFPSRLPFNGVPLKGETGTGTVETSEAVNWIFMSFDDQLGFSFPTEAPARRIWRVADLVSAVRTTVERGYSDVWIEGEISNFRAAESGHLYFVLKDGEAMLRVVMFRSQARLLRFKPADGLQIIARGRITIYEQRGELQLSAEFLEPRGAGALQLAFEQLKAKLAEEGLFDRSRRKPIPQLPRKIGIVTSPRGAALQDMLNVLARRHESVGILIYPAQVQGETAASEVAAGVRYFNRHKAVDVIVVARGGGSAEDLASFNHEGLARTIAASRIPVISAVGHETDFTIADFVADKRAPTPSAAAEMVIESKVQLHQRVDSLRTALERAARYRVQMLWRSLENKAIGRAFERVRATVRKNAQQVDDLERRLSRQDVRMRLRENCEHAADLGRRLQQAMSLRVERERGRLSLAVAQLNNLGPQQVLDRGYAVVTAMDGQLIRDAEQVRSGDRLNVNVSNGKFGVEVT